MKISVLLLILFVFVSCQNNEVEQLTIEVEELQEEISELNDRVKTLSDSLIECHIRETEGNTWKQIYDEYRYGSGACVTRYVKDQGKVTICGAENIIDFLNKHYEP